MLSDDPKQLCGTLFIIAAPSGAGKTTLVTNLLAVDHHLEVCVSHTTRPKRPAEVDGVNYYFVDDDTFQNMIEADAFLEYATVFTHRYGTSCEAVERILGQGKDIILEIDWQGAQQVRKLFPSCVSIFILPPSIEVLAKRLETRAQDPDHIISHRMEMAKDEMSHYDEFDYLVINDNRHHAFADLKAIIHAARCRLPIQQRRYHDLVTELLA